VNQQYERLAGDVVAVLSQVNDVEANKLKTVSNAYSAAVGEINERLRKATSLLHKGLRDEAIQECEREPNLLDAFESLDIHDQELWLKMHRSLSVPIPPPLLVQHAAELNSAYALQAPLTELLRKHRLLALGHASLSNRIQILRQISQKDPNSDVWHADIKSYETERIAEIKSELPKIKQSKNLAAIQQLYREVNSDAWVVPVPDEVRSQANDLLHQFEVASAREKISQCSIDLQAAFSEFDLERGFELQDTWELYLGPATLPSDHELWAETQPALDWLQEQQEKQQKEVEQATLLSDLESLLDSEESTRADLDATYNRLSATGAELPPVLVRRYRNQIQSIQTRDRRSQTLKLVGIVGTLAICAGAVFMGIRSFQHTSKVRQATAALNTHRENRQWQDGLTFVSVTQETATDVYESTRFQDAKARFDKELDNDNGRLREFERLVEAVRSGGVTIEDAPEIAALKKLAVTHEESQLCAELDSEKDKHDALKALDAADAFNQTIGAINTNFVTSKDTSTKQLKAFLTEIEQARTDHPYALRDRQNSVDVSEVDELLEERIKAAIADTERDSKAGELVAEIDKNLGQSIELYISKLGILQETLKGLEPGRQINATLAEKKIWLQLLQVSETLSPLSRKAHTVTVVEAEELLKTLKSNAEEFGKIPEKFSPLENHLLAVTKRPNLIEVSLLVPQGVRDPESPHANLVQSLLRQYKELKENSSAWDKTFHTILDSLYRDKTLPPILKIKLYRAALGTAMQGSLAIEMGFAPVMKQLKSSELETMLQQDSVEEVRAFAENLAHPTAMKRHGNVVKGLGNIPESVQWVGWMRPKGLRDDSADNSTSGTVEPAVRPGALDGHLGVFVFDENGDAKLEKVGSIKNGRAQMTKETFSQLARPLYWIKK